METTSCLQQGSCHARLQEWSGQTAKGTSRRYFIVRLGLTIQKRGKTKWSATRDLKQDMGHLVSAESHHSSEQCYSSKLWEGSGNVKQEEAERKWIPMCGWGAVTSPTVGQSIYFRGDNAHIGLKLCEILLHLIHVFILVYLISHNKKLISLNLQVVLKRC